MLPPEIGRMQGEDVASEEIHNGIAQAQVATIMSHGLPPLITTGTPGSQRRAEPAGHRICSSGTSGTDASRISRAGLRVNALRGACAHCAGATMRVA